MDYQFAVEQLRREEEEKKELANRAAVVEQAAMFAEGENTNSSRLCATSTSASTGHTNDLGSQATLHRTPSVTGTGQQVRGIDQIRDELCSSGGFNAT